MTDAAFAPFRRKMEDAGLPEVAIRTFAHYFRLLREGETGVLSGRTIDAVGDLPHADALEGTEAAGREALARTVVVKLNGGLGTSMGMSQAKSLVPVKDGLSFLDIMVRQVLHLRQALDVRLPLLLMNSFRSQADTLAALESYPDLDVGLGLDFLQHRVPRVLAESLTPVDWADDPAHEWCPPGHGDVYTALRTSGLLERLRAEGFEYLFLSNSDNLGAVMEPRILGHFVQSGAPFLMEVAERTANDRKGGHLARRKDGGLVLRETAQCPPDEVDDFQDVDKYRYFNTNNLWVRLDALDQALAEHDQVLPLPMMRNEKHVVPTDRSTPRVYQTETAMGAAIAVFEGAQALRVPRTRFAPVKTTNDLLGLWSDLYRLHEDFRLLPAGGRTFRDLVIDLDPQHYQHLAGFLLRFPHGAPSLAEASVFQVRGDVQFGRDVVIRGEVRVHHEGAEPLQVGDRQILSD